MEAAQLKCELVAPLQSLFELLCSKKLQIENVSTLNTTKNEYEININAYCIIFGANKLNGRGKAMGNGIKIKINETV